MGPVWSVARVDLRARLVTLIGLTIVVALSSAVVLTAVVGARRASSTVSRFHDWSYASDATLQTDSIETARQVNQAVAGVPNVRDSTLRYLVNGFPSGADESTPDFAIYTDPSGRYGTDIDRPLLLRGRPPDATAPDEVMLDELASRVLSLDVGDHVQVATWTRDDLDALGSGGGFPGFNGPTLDLTVVGVGRMAEGLAGDLTRASLLALAGPGFLDAHPNVGAWPPVVALRVDEPARDVPALTQELASRGVPREKIDPVAASEEYFDSVRHSVEALTTGLWIFALVAAVAAAVGIGQAVSRQVAAGGSTTSTTRALGMTRAQRALAGIVPILAAATVGVVLGVGLAIACSPVLPTGLAGRIEVDPGVWVDGWALAAGALAVLVLVAAWSMAISWRTQRQTLVTQEARRPSAVANRLAAWGAPPVLVTGVRNTFEARGQLSVSVRSALLATVIAVAGVVGAGVVVASLHDLTSDPARWGWTWSSEPDAFNGPDPTDQLVHDDRVEAVAVEQSSSIVVGGQRLNAFAIEPLKGTIAFTTAAGRLPQGPSEVALERAIMTSMGLHLGDKVQALSADGSSPTDLTVVGVAAVPADAGPGRSAVLTKQGLVAAAVDTVDATVLLRYPEGSDATKIESQLADDYGLSFPLFSHAQVPGPVRNVGQGREVAFGLAAFFFLLGVAGLFHALTLSTRRRRADFGVLRAMGLRRSQVRRCVLTQSVAMMVVGLLVGIPAGLVLGRAAWARLVGGLSVVDWPTTPWVLLAVLVPTALLASVVIGALPARAAAHVPTSSALRGE